MSGHVRGRHVRGTVPLSHVSGIRVSGGRFSCHMSVVSGCQEDGSLVILLSYSCHIHCSMLLWQECYKKNYIVRDNVGMS